MIRFTKIDLIKMARSIHPLCLADAKYVVERFQSAMNVGDLFYTDDVMRFVRFVGLFAHNVLEVRESGIFPVGVSSLSDTDIKNRILGV